MDDICIINLHIHPYSFWTKENNLYFSTLLSTDVHVQTFLQVSLMLFDPLLKNLGSWIFHHSMSCNFRDIPGSYIFFMIRTFVEVHHPDLLREGLLKKGIDYAEFNFSVAQILMAAWKSSDSYWCIQCSTEVTALLVENEENCIFGEILFSDVANSFAHFLAKGDLASPHPHTLTGGALPPLNATGGEPTDPCFFPIKKSRAPPHRNQPRTWWTCTATQVHMKTYEVHNALSDIAISTVTTAKRTRATYPPARGSLTRCITSKSRPTTVARGTGRWAKC